MPARLLEKGIAASQRVLFALLDADHNILLALFSANLSALLGFCSLEGKNLRKSVFDLVTAATWTGARRKAMRYEDMYWGLLDTEDLGDNENDDHDIAAEGCDDEILVEEILCDDDDFFKDN
ncbi:hypothetical protein ACHHYP_20253 [Achlya hypogyna]|uniref:Uncharacterized protein n=1 Tax=Achlya hypogyna TaxID=1202772 RepID=A0A1V9YUK9_ACHHY|nr:hypothetical protein ACHHYP_20253 [Achlya hypogyna]